MNVPAPSGPTVWKVLVLDQFTKDVIATVLRVQDLRDVGVTLHVYVSLLLPSLHSLRRLDWLRSYLDLRQLHSNRPPLPDVPAVYFVAPTLQNIRRIAQDLEKSLYESFHISFVEPLSRALLEELAAAAAKDGTGELITQVGSRRASSVVSCLCSGCLIVGQVGVRPVPFLHISFTPTLLSGASTTSASTGQRSSAAWSFDYTHILSHPQLSPNDRTGNRS